MSYLLDTNVISETIKSKPSKNLYEWFEKIPEENLFISVLTLGEIRRGVELLDNIKKKSALIVWLEKDLRNRFGDRILRIDNIIADRWGYLCAYSAKTLPVIDSLIAATALTYNLKLVTRNTKDFLQVQDLELINPF